MKLQESKTHSSAVAPRELKALRLLIDHPNGLYGSEFVSKSDGFISRGTIYTTLERLVEKGYVREVEQEPTSEYQLRRTKHFITGLGQRAVQEYCQLMGFQMLGPAHA